VPPGVAAIVKRMMAKQPEDRFQTPASAALALLSFARRTPSLTANIGSLPALRSPATPTVRDDTPLPPALTSKRTATANRADDTAFADAE
jgi:hypothetical protein